MQNNVWKEHADSVVEKLYYCIPPKGKAGKKEPLAENVGNTEIFRKIRSNRSQG